MVYGPRTPNRDEDGFDSPEGEGSSDEEQLRKAALASGMPLQHNDDSEQPNKNRTNAGNQHHSIWAPQWKEAFNFTVNALVV